MRYNKLIKELEYWKDISGQANPEVVINLNDSITTLEIEDVSPSSGIEEAVSIGLIVSL